MISHDSMYARITENSIMLIINRPPIRIVVDIDVAVAAVKKGNFVSITRTVLFVFFYTFVFFSFLF